jgi:hypothetical protein
LYILFLALFPASISPWIFVQMVPRYLPILTPSLAAGVALAADPWLRRSVWPAAHQLAGLALFGFAVAGFAIADPAEAYPSYMQNEFVAIQQMLDRAPRWQVKEIWFPPGYENRLPDHVYHRGDVRVRVVNRASDLRGLDPHSAIFVADEMARYLLSFEPQRRLPTANLGVSKQRHDEFLESIRQLVAGTDCQLMLVAAARGSTRYWAERVGVAIGGTDDIVGMLILPSGMSVPPEP